jgi:hypothetical protein
MRRTTDNPCWSGYEPVPGKQRYTKGSCRRKTEPSKRRKSRSWSEMAPKKGKERDAMLKRCGSKCFLDPKNKKYPICAKGSCKVNKKGLRAAYSRSRQWHHEKIANKARKKLKKSVPKKKKSVKRRKSVKGRKSVKRRKSKRKSTSGLSKMLSEEDEINKAADTGDVFLSSVNMLDEDAAEIYTNRRSEIKPKVRKAIAELVSDYMKNSDKINKEVEQKIILDEIDAMYRVNQLLINDDQRHQVDKAAIKPRRNSTNKYSGIAQQLGTVTNREMDDDEIIFDKKKITRTVRGPQTKKSSGISTELARFNRSGNSADKEIHYTDTDHTNFTEILRREMGKMIATKKTG